MREPDYQNIFFVKVERVPGFIDCLNKWDRSNDAGRTIIKSVQAIEDGFVMIFVERALAYPFVTNKMEEYVRGDNG